MSTLNDKVAEMNSAPPFFAPRHQVFSVSNPPSPAKPVVVVKYRGLQSGCGITRSIPLFDVVDGPVDLIGSTRAVESLEAEGYEVKEAA